MSESLVVPLQPMRSALCGASTSSGSWRTSLACCVRWRAFITCCTAGLLLSASHGRGIAKPIPSSRRPFCKSCPIDCRRSPPSILANGSEFTFKTSRVLGSKGRPPRCGPNADRRPTAVRQTQYQYLWVLGAVCPETGQAEGLLSPQLNTSIVSTFLEQFSGTLSEDEQAVMIWDGAGFHVSGKLQVPHNISLMKLPPYSPELNPIENLWHYLKSHFWSNRSYPDYDALEDAAIQAWKKAVLDTELMKSVCAAPYLERASSD